MAHRKTSQTNMAELPPPSLRLTIDADVLADNWRALDAMSGEAKTGAAVKADCYALGVDACVPALRDAGCTHFFVAHWSEVEAVASHVPPARISVLHGPMNAADAAYAQQTGAAPVINSVSQARLWHESGGGTCQLMVDTGINRLGVSLGDLSDPAIASLDVDILMSHLACADEDNVMNARQLAVFKQATEVVPHQSASLTNSAGIALGSAYHFDLTRPGLALYGGVPRPELANKIRQVARPEAAILQTRSLSAGESVGYNAEFTAQCAMPTGVVSLGYADGFFRSRGGEGSHLLLGKTRLPIVGKVSMDMLIVDLSNAPSLREGDWLEVPFHLPDVAPNSGLSQYELLTTLGQRFKPR